MKRWDVFISHASEDKETVALPLATALQRAGILVWLDRFELRIGDSLREKIDEGLAESCFGIVVLSSSFLTKGWPRRELNGLMALEESGRKVILPVWHEITKSELAEHSPILADRLAADTSGGISSIVRQLIPVILDPGGGCPSVVAPGVALRLNRLLDRAHNAGEVTDFLAAHSDIICAAAGADADASLRWKADLAASDAAADIIPDVAIGRLWRTVNRRSWEFFVFREPGTQVFNEQGEISAPIASALHSLAGWREWLGSNRRAAAGWFADIAMDFPCTVVAGRRDGTSAEQKRQLADLNDSLVGTRIRTYDWLVEAATRLDERRTR